MNEAVGILVNTFVSCQVFKSSNQPFQQVLTLRKVESSRKRTSGVVNEGMFVEKLPISQLHLPHESKTSNGEELERE